jgi:hypothetical protein
LTPTKDKATNTLKTSFTLTKAAMTSVIANYDDDNIYSDE